MKSTLLNMTAVLFGITLVASAGVGFVNMITVEPIAAAKEAATLAALNEVLPAFDATTTEELTIDDMPITVYTATAGGSVSGYAVQSMTKQGFGGVVRLMVGFTPEGEVVNVNVLEQTETPGLGTKMADEGNPLFASFEGRNPGEMKLAVKKDGGKEVPVRTEDVEKGIVAIVGIVILIVRQEKCLPVGKMGIVLPKVCIVRKNKLNIVRRMRGRRQNYV